MKKVVRWESANNPALKSLAPGEMPMVKIKKARLTKHRPTIYNGIRYQSKLEAIVAQELDLRIKAGDIKSWERQVKISLDVNRFHICNYFIDFVVINYDGTKEYIEAKGMETQLWKTKWRLFEAIMNEEVKSGKAKLVIRKRK